MSKIARTLFVVILLPLFYSSVFAQDYTSAIGLRTGSSSGVNLKYFAGPTSAIEGMLVYHRTSLRIVGLFEQHFSLGRNSNSALYLGIGGHFGYGGLFDSELVVKEVYGVDFVIGFEYIFPHSPFGFSIDMKPLVELSRGTAFSGNNAGISLRYTLD